MPPSDTKAGLQQFLRQCPWANSGLLRQGEAYCSSIGLEEGFEGCVYAGISRTEFGPPGVSSYLQCIPSVAETIHADIIFQPCTSGGCKEDQFEPL